MVEMLLMVIGTISVGFILGGIFVLGVYWYLQRHRRLTLIKVRQVQAPRKDNVVQFRRRHEDR